MACIETGRDRHPILREHDVDALAHLASSTEDKAESWMMLTWDKTFMDALDEAFYATFQNVEPCGNGRAAFFR